MDANARAQEGFFREVVSKPEEETDGMLWEAGGYSARSRMYRWDLDWLESEDREMNTPIFSFGGALWRIRASETEGGATAISLDLCDIQGPRSFDGVHVRWNTALIQYPESGRWSRSLGKNDESLVIGTTTVNDSASLYPRSLRVEFELRLEPQPSQIPRTGELARDLKQLHLSGDASDATVSVKGRDFPVHRCILAARTPVFASMFKHEMSERETGLVDIEDCEPETFQRFLQYVYTGGVEDLDPVDASALYEVADKYQVDELKADCLEVIKRGLSVDSFCSTLAFAHMHLQMELLGMATEFFSSNFKEILPKVEWQQFLAEHPTHANELLIKSLVLAAPPVIRSQENSQGCSQKQSQERSSDCSQERIHSIPYRSQRRYRRPSITLNNPFGYFIPTQPRK